MAYGQCTNCGSVEVELVKVDGVQDLSCIGESSEYPYGSIACEVCDNTPDGFRSATAPTDWIRGTTLAFYYNQK